MNKKQKGFSLIELLIVVAIILIIAAIAIPNLLRARIAANEASAVGSVRSIVTAEVAYSSTWGTGFAQNLGNLGGVGAPCAATAATACLIDNVLSTGAKSGYNFVAPGGAPDAAGHIDTFVVTGNPQLPVGTTGQRAFCSDESGVVRFDPTGLLTPATDAGCQGTEQALQ
jgi:type IV pilus assembly protein PilA